MVKINIIIKSKKGWIRLVEVFIAILLLTGVLLIVVNRINPSDKNSLSIEISKKELAILRDIELNNSLRTDILGATIPVEWNNFGSELQNVKNRIIFLTPSNLECEAKICQINEACFTNGFSEKNIYTNAIFISSNLNTYSPRQLKLFCWVK